MCRVTIGGRTSAYVQQVQKLRKVAAKQTATEEVTTNSESDLTPLSDEETTKKGSRKRKVSQGVGLLHYNTSQIKFIMFRLQLNTLFVNGPKSSIVELRKLFENV